MNKQNQSKDYIILIVFVTKSGPQKLIISLIHICFINDLEILEDICLNWLKGVKLGTSFDH